MELTFRKQWASLVEAIATSEIFELQKEFQQLPEMPEKNQLLMYSNLMIDYYRQDHEKIKRYNFSDDVFRILQDIRIQICSGVDLNRIQHQQNSIASMNNDPLLLGEIHYVIALASQSAGDFLNSENSFMAAALHLEQGGAFKKSLRARLSSIAAYSCRRVDARLFSEYYAVFTKALEIHDYQSATVALINISREFQVLEAATVALEYANQAVEYSRGFNSGTRENGLSYLQRAHIYFQMNRIADGRRDLYHAMIIQHHEVQSGLKVLAEKYQIDIKTLQSHETLPTWKERKSDKEQVHSLGKLEAKVLELLAQRPRRKNELMELLYGDSIDFYSSEARLKNLLARLRKRFPSLLIYESEHYKISDPAASELLIRKKDQVG